MSIKQESIGDRIAIEFSRDKVHLSHAERRRLAGMIDADAEARSNRYNDLLQTLVQCKAKWDFQLIRADRLEIDAAKKPSAPKHGVLYLTDFLRHICERTDAIPLRCLSASEVMSIRLAANWIDRHSGPIDDNWCGGSLAASIRNRDLAAYADVQQDDEKP